MDDDAVPALDLSGLDVVDSDREECSGVALM